MTKDAPAFAITNPLEDHIGYHLRRASALTMGMLSQRLAEVELTIAEASVLVLIDSNEGLTQSEVGRLLGIKRANMAPLTAALERRGLVRRETITGRSIALATTSHGRSIATRAKTIMLMNDAAVFASLDAETKRQLREILLPVWSGELNPHVYD